MTEAEAPTVVGRYVLHAPIARGGMATIHLARLVGAEGFSRMVAAKRLHPQFTEDAEFISMFLDEARIASKIHHPNVVPMLDVVQMGSEVILVQEYVHGLSFDKLLRAANQQKMPLPVEVIVAIMSGMLAGLSATHEAKDELGESLNIVHRDVSPHNVLVGVDGIPRLLDFGVAKATVNVGVTRTGVFKGKIVYAAPEQLRGAVTPLSDIYAAAVALWESLVGRRPYAANSEAELISAVTSGSVQRLTEAIDKASVPPERWALLERLDAVVSKGMAFEVEDRYASAAEMQEALLAAAPAATTVEVSKWVKLLGKTYLEGREKLIVTEESSWRQRPNAGPSSTRTMTSRLTPANGLPVDESFERTATAPASFSSTPARIRTSPTLRASVHPLKQERRRVDWAIAAALLLIGGLLAGILILLLRKSIEPTVAAAPTALQKPPALVAQPPQAQPPQVPPAPNEAAPTPPTRVVASTPVEPSATAAAPAIGGTRPLFGRKTPRAGASATARAGAAPSAAPTVDCSTPFYFDGTKKIFKPGCL